MRQQWAQPKGVTYGPKTLPIPGYFLWRIEQEYNVKAPNMHCYGRHWTISATSIAVKCKRILKAAIECWIHFWAWQFDSRQTRTEHPNQKFWLRQWRQHIQTKTVRCPFPCLFLLFGGNNPSYSVRSCDLHAAEPSASAAILKSYPIKKTVCRRLSMTAILRCCPCSSRLINVTQASRYRVIIRHSLIFTANSTLWTVICRCCCSDRLLKLSQRSRRLKHRYYMLRIEMSYLPDFSNQEIIFLGILYSIRMYLGPRDLSNCWKFNRLSNLQQLGTVLRTFWTWRRAWTCRTSRRLRERRTPRRTPDRAAAVHAGSSTYTAGASRIWSSRASRARRTPLRHTSRTHHAHMPVLTPYDLWYSRVDTTPHFITQLFTARYDPPKCRSPEINKYK